MPACSSTTPGRFMLNDKQNNDQVPMGAMWVKKPKKKKKKYIYIYIYIYIWNFIIIAIVYATNRYSSSFLPKEHVFQFFIRKRKRNKFCISSLSEF